MNRFSFRRLMEATFDKISVNYRYSGMKSSTDPRCGICKFYIDPNGCSKVNGLIRAVDLCDLYAPKTKKEANPETGHAELTRHDGSDAVASFRNDMDRKKKLQQVMPTHEGIADMDADELQSWLDDNEDHLTDDEIEQIQRAIALKQLGDDEEQESDVSMRTLKHITGMSGMAGNGCADDTCEPSTRDRLGHCPDCRDFQGSEQDEKAVETFRAKYKSGEVGFPPGVNQKPVFGDVQWKKGVRGDMSEAIKTFREKLGVSRPRRWMGEMSRTFWEKWLKH